MPGPNIILIVIDALRARNLGCYGYDKPTSPAIDDLARRSAVFERCFSTTNVTDPSFTTILSGKFPPSHGLIEQGLTSEGIYTKRLGGLALLPSVLKERGYVTIGVDWLGRWHKWGFDYYSGPIGQRLKLFNNMTLERIKGNAAIGRSINLMKRLFGRGVFSPFRASLDKAASVTDWALDATKALGEQNFFLFIHYWDTHVPYQPPREHLAQLKGESYHPAVDRIEDILAGLKNPDWKHFLGGYIGKVGSIRDVLASYDASIHYLDSEIARLVRVMESRGQMEDTVMIITADHGESLLEHGIYFDHHGLYDELIHVPLIFCYPQKITAQRIRTTVQHVELVPTILDLIGAPSPGYDFDGLSLAGYLEGREGAGDLRPFVYAEEARSQRKFVIRTERFKYIFALSESEATCNYCGRIHGGMEELYDLEQDPAEEHNIVSKNPEIRNELRERLLEFREGLQKKRGKRRLGERIKNLRALGKI